MSLPVKRILRTASHRAASGPGPGAAGPWNRAGSLKYRLQPVLIKTASPAATYSPNYLSPLNPPRQYSSSWPGPRPGKLTEFPVPISLSKEALDGG